MTTPNTLQTICNHIALTTGRRGAYVTMTAEQDIRISYKDDFVITSSTLLKEWADANRWTEITTYIEHLLNTLDAPPSKYFVRLEPMPDLESAVKPGGQIPMPEFSSDLTPDQPDTEWPRLSLEAHSSRLDELEGEDANNRLNRLEVDLVERVDKLEARADDHDNHLRNLSYKRQAHNDRIEKLEDGCHVHPPGLIKEHGERIEKLEQQMNCPWRKDGLPTRIMKLEDGHADHRLNKLEIRCSSHSIGRLSDRIKKLEENQP